MNGNFRQLAKQAKSRMTRGTARCQEAFEEEMYRKVVTILESGQPITNPIAVLLAARGQYDEALREKYVFETSALYLRLKRRYESQQNRSGASPLH